MHARRCVAPPTGPWKAVRRSFGLGPLVAGGLLVLGGCGDDGVGPGTALSDLHGSWQATRFEWTRTDGPEAEPVDLIALGGAMTLTISSDGQIVMTTREVGADQSQTVLGAGRILEGGRLELDTGASPVILDYTLSGPVLRLQGRLELRAGGLAEPEEVSLDAILIRMATSPG